jgi:hypothetical protein
MLVGRVRLRLSTHVLPTLCVHMLCMPLQGVCQATGECEAAAASPIKANVLGSTTCPNTLPDFADVPELGYALDDECFDKNDPERECDPAAYSTASSVPGAVPCMDVLRRSV